MYKQAPAGMGEFFAYKPPGMRGMGEYFSGVGQYNKSDGTDAALVAAVEAMDDSEWEALPDTFRSTLYHWYTGGYTDTDTGRWISVCTVSAYKGQAHGLGRFNQLDSCDMMLVDVTESLSDYDWSHMNAGFQKALIAWYNAGATAGLGRVRRRPPRRPVVHSGHLRGLGAAAPLTDDDKKNLAMYAGGGAVVGLLGAVMLKQKKPMGMAAGVGIGAVLGLGAFYATRPAAA